MIVDNFGILLGAILDDLCGDENLRVIRSGGSACSQIGANMTLQHLEPLV